MNELIHHGLLLPVCLLIATSCSPEKREMAGKGVDMEILFHDPMTADWRENWFLEGRNSTVENRAEGLYFAGGTVTKEQDPEEYHAHHAVLWTKREFEGDIRISYLWTQVDESNYGNILLYVQAQGVGDGLHVKDISKWSEMRSIPAMDKYFKNMDLISLSIRDNVRCKRYPWFDREGNPYRNGGMIDPMVDYKEKIVPGKVYRIVVEKRESTISMTITDTETSKGIIDHTWDTTKIDERVEPKLITKGRIGLRHMSTKQSIYKDFKIERL